METRVEPPGQKTESRELRSEVRVAPHMCIERALLPHRVVQADRERAGRHQKGQGSGQHPREDDRPHRGRRTDSGRRDQQEGGRADAPRSAVAVVHGRSWTRCRVRDYERFQPLTEDEKSTAREIFSYWKGKSVFDKWIAVVPPEFQKLNFRTWATGGSQSSRGHPPGPLLSGLRTAHERGGRRHQEAGGREARGARPGRCQRLQRVPLLSGGGYHARRPCRVRGAATRSWRETWPRWRPTPQRKAELERIAANCDTGAGRDLPPASGKHFSRCGSATSRSCSKAGARASLSAAWTSISIPSTRATSKPAGSRGRRRSS